jgi:hypothetical protein
VSNPCEFILRGRRARGIFAVLFLYATTTFGADPWIARPLRLPPFGVSADAALGVAVSTSIYPAPKYDTPVGTLKPGAGLNIEAALGLPLGLAVGLRMGIRFGANGALTNADAYGRLYDPLSLHVDTGTDSLAEPELRVQETFVDTRVISAALDVRLIPRNYSVLMPGVPLRFRIPRHLRIDTGVYFPIAFIDFISHPANWGLELPVAAWVQHERIFAGLLSGFSWNNQGTDPPASVGVPGEVDVRAGVGVGYTLGGLWDLKAQLLTTRINDASWTRYFGGGVGVGLVVP